MRDTSTDRFKTINPNIWKELDEFDASSEAEDDVQSARDFHRTIADEIKWKTDLDNAIPSGSETSRVNLSNTTAVPELSKLPGTGDIAPQFLTSPGRPQPSFNPSSFLQTSTPKQTPNATFPHVPTPSPPSTPQLPPPPAPPLASPPRPSIPIDPKEGQISTPTFSKSISSLSHNSTYGEGRGRRDDPSSPVPIGTPVLKGKKDFVKLTKHFEAFSKQIARAQSTSSSGSGSQLQGKKGRGREPIRRSTSVQGLGLGGKIFEGLRFCIPPELNQETKHKTRWTVIAGLAGSVTLQPDTAVTHVICDPPKSASALARDLGLEVLSELPEGTVCVKWDWVVKCKMTGKLLDTTPWLSFPRNALTARQTKPSLVPASIRIQDITEQLRGSSTTSVNRKRQHTASESETDSQKRPRESPTIPRTIPILPPIYELEMLPPPLPLKQTLPEVPPSNRPQHEEEHSRTATTHGTSGGPGWIDTSESERDGLDEMITGVVQGKFVDEEEDSDAEGDKRDTPKKNHKEERSSPGGNPDTAANKYKAGQPHDGKPSTGPNEWLAKKFEDMFNMYEGVQGKSVFAIQGYRKAAGIMRRTTYPITSGAQALSIRGIGTGMAERIDEFISGGPGRAFFEDNEQTRTVRIFKDIYGVGRTFANELYKRGARTIDDLKTHDYGLTPGQKIGVDLYDDLTTRIPREECKSLFEIIKEEATGLDSKIWIEIMGSYRRGQETSGDVDILITRDNSDEKTHAGLLPRLIKALKMRGTITHDLGTPHDPNAEEAKWMGVGRVNYTAKYRRIDILCIPFEQWGAALIYFTGNEVFNRSLRLYARKQGYSLNQRGLSVGVIRDGKGLKMTEGEIIASKTEEEIFGVLGIRWRHPHQRRP